MRFPVQDLICHIVELLPRLKGIATNSSDDGGEAYHVELLPRLKGIATRFPVRGIRHFQLNFCPA